MNRLDTIRINGVDYGISGTVTVDQSYNASSTNAQSGVAVAAAVNGKADKTTTVNGHALSGNVTVTKSDVGLGNVTNDAQVKRSEMGTASGVATLDSTGKVPSSQLPSYVDDVIEGYLKASDGKFYKTKSGSTYSDVITGEAGKIYTDLDTNRTYRWSGSAYTQIKGDLVIGTATGNAADGKIVNDHVNNTSNPHGVTKAQVGLGSVVNTGDSATPVSNGTTKFTTGGAYTELAKKVDKVSGKGLSTNDYTTDEKNKLSGIASGAQTNVIETVKVNGTALTPSSKAVDVTVPTKTSELTNNSNFVSDASYVHTDNNYTATEKSKLGGIASGAEVNQNAFSNVGVKVGNTTTTVAADAKTDTVTLIQGSNVTLTADTTNDTVTIAAKDTTYSAATTTAAGLMSADDKTKLNGIAAGAEVNVNADWNATSGDAQILNKPTIPAAVAVKGNAESSYRTGNVNITPANIGLGNVGNFKAVSTVASQGLTDTEKSNARSNIGAGTSSFSGSYNDLSNKPTIPAAAANGTYTIKTLVGSTTTSVSDFTANQSSADDLTIVQGANVTITPDATNRRITIAATNTNTWRPVSDSVSSTSSSDAASSKAVKTAYDLAASKTANTGTVTKVTAGTGLTGGDITTTGTIALATSGVTAGTYKRVTVDAYGRVTAGDNTDANDNTARLQVSDTTNKRINTKESTGNYIQFTAGTNKFTIGDGTNSFDVAVTPSVTFPVSSVVGSTGAITVAQVATALTNAGYKLTDNNTTYSSLSAAANGTSVSLVTTGEKYTWNSKQAQITDLAQIGCGYGTVNSYDPENPTTESVTISNFTLIKNCLVSVLFTRGFTASNMKLNVSNTGAKPIFYHGSAVSPFVVRNNSLAILQYDGTNWNIVSIEKIVMNTNSEAVDLGLPSGTLWCTHNIGASKPEEYGLYFSWGNTTGYASGAYTFSQTNYNSSPGGQYTGTVLSASYDAAHVNMNGEWRMPTYAECQELCTMCTVTSSTLNGVAGFLYTSKQNGKSIFIPCGGFIKNSQTPISPSYSFTWAATKNNGNPCCIRNGVALGGEGYTGMNIRPVM